MEAAAQSLPRRLPAPRRVPRAAAVPTAVFFVTGLAAASLLLPSTPTYDPWAWIIWGREVLALDLSTVGGPSWKPLPVLFTTAFAPAGDAAPALWLVVARAGGLLSLLLAFLLARRLAGPIAGVVALFALVLSLDFGRTVWLGNSEGLLVAALLGAVLLALDDRHREGFGATAAAALLRPEVWPFAAIYGLWLLWRRPELRRLTVAAGAVVVALWLLPELWGSGSLLRAAERAQEPNLDSPAFAADPALAVLRRAEPVLAEPFRLAALAGVAAALGTWLRRRGERPTLAIAAGAVAWLGLVAWMTERGFSGNPRYLIAPAALACVVAGVGAGRTAGAVRARAGSARTIAIAAAVVALAAPAIADRAQALGRQAASLGYQTDLRAALETALARSGGPGAVRACGSVHVERFSVPLLAWLLGARLGEVGFEPQAPAVAFRARAHAGAPLEPASVAGLERRFAQGRWTVYASCRSRPLHGSTPAP